MFFTSGTFWLFFLISGALYFLVPAKIRWTVLLAASLVFYGHWKIGFLLLLLAHVAWIFFRSVSLEKVCHYVKCMKLKMNGMGISHLVFDVALVLLFLFLESLDSHRSKWPWIRRIPAPLKLAAVALFVCLIAILAVNSGNEFIYVQF